MSRSRPSEASDSVRLRTFMEEEVGGGGGVEDVTKNPKYCIHFRTRTRLPISNTPYLCLPSDLMLSMNYVPLNLSVSVQVQSLTVLVLV